MHFFHTIKRNFYLTATINHSCTQLEMLDERWNICPPMYKWGYHAWDTKLNHFQRSHVIHVQALVISLGNICQYSMLGLYNTTFDEGPQSEMFPVNRCQLHLH